jgi:type IV pilus assembly protein PilF
MIALSWPALLRRTSRTGGLALVLVLAAGCSTKKSTAGVRDPEKASLAEHDVAADEFNKGNLRSALVHAQKALDLDEENHQAQLLAATIYLGFCATSSEECRLPEAEKHARTALKLKPDFASASNTLGVILIRQQRYEEAISVLKPLTENMVYSTPELAWGNLGQAYLEKGDADQAILSLKKAVALQPGFCVGSYRLGLAYERKADLRAASQAYSSTLDNTFEQCKFADAYEARARVLLKLNEINSARADLEQCIRIGVNSAVAKRCETTLKQAPTPLQNRGKGPERCSRTPARGPLKPMPPPGVDQAS